LTVPGIPRSNRRLAKFVGAGLVGAQCLILEQVRVRDRTLNQCEKHVAASLLSSGAWLVRRRTTAPKSISWKSILTRARRICFAPTLDDSRMPPTSVGDITTIFSPL